MGINDCAQAAFRAGLRGTPLVVSVAIAGAEGGYSITNADGSPVHNYSDRTKDDSWGPWQVNYYGNLRAERLAKYGDPMGLVDPTVDPSSGIAEGYERSAAAMSDISGGGRNFKDWSTFTSGAYLANMLQAANACNQIPGALMTDPGAAIPSNPTPLPIPIYGIGNVPGEGVVGNAVGALVSPFKSVVDIFNAIARFITNPHDIWRIIQVVGGAILMIMGIAFINKDAFESIAQQTGPAVAKIGEVAAA